MSDQRTNEGPGRPGYGPAVLVAAGAAAVGLVVWAASRGRPEGPSGAPTADAGPTTPDAPPTRAEALLRVVRGFLPEETSILAEPDPRWDAILGGRKGPDLWAYYQWAKGAKYGTTCGIFAAACAAYAGLPREIINREPPEGSGYVPSHHIKRIWDGAGPLGWRMAYDGKSGLVPGDIYCQARNGTFNGKPTRIEHVGIVLSCLEDGRGGWILETADAGQTHPETLRQCAKRTRRIVVGKKITNTKTGAVAELQWLVRPKG